MSEDPYGFAIGVLTTFGFSVLLAYFVLFVVKEKENGAKHLQFVSGVHSSTYWLANYLFDNLIILIVIALSTIVVAVFQISSFSAGEPLGAVVLLMVSLLSLSLSLSSHTHPHTHTTHTPTHIQVLTCFAGLPFTYVCSYFFTDNLIAFIVLVVYYFFLPTVSLHV